LPHEPLSLYHPQVPQPSSSMHPMYAPHPPHPDSNAARGVLGQATNYNM
jgi:hypothetical protein